MQRRDFLKLVTAAPLAAWTGGAAWAATAPDYRRLLVLVELKGGNDGLNTVIPYADREYSRLRPRLGIPRDQVVALDEATGLHPSLKALLPLWQDRELAIVQGVGYPKPNLSHFRSIEIWDTASDSDTVLDKGWLTQVFERQPVPRDFAADGVAVGSADLGPLAGSGTRAIALRNTDQFLRQARQLEPATGASRNLALAHLIKVEADVQQAARGLQGDHQFRSPFPKGQFGNALKTAAQVVAAKSNVAVIRVTHNGFDTHSNQLNVHARLLTELAEGLAAFKTAMQEIHRWDSTLVMTYAEFGRRPQENGSNGTDHGTASCHFLLGGKTQGGLYGEPPRLGNLEGGNLRHAVDFRSLYATVAERWWGIPSAGLFGQPFRPLELIKA